MVRREEYQGIFDFHLLFCCTVDEVWDEGNEVSLTEQSRDSIDH